MIVQNLHIVTLTESVKSSQNSPMHINWRLILAIKLQNQDNTAE